MKESKIKFVGGDILGWIPPFSIVLVGGPKQAGPQRAVLPAVQPGWQPHPSLEAQLGPLQDTEVLPGNMSYLLLASLPNMWHLLLGRSVMTQLAQMVNKSIKQVERCLARWTLNPPIPSNLQYDFPLPGRSWGCTWAGAWQYSLERQPGLAI